LPEKSLLAAIALLLEAVMVPAAVAVLASSAAEIPLALSASPTCRTTFPGKLSKITFAVQATCVVPTSTLEATAEVQAAVSSSIALPTKLSTLFAPSTIPR
jgi:hypothetical protein